MRTISSDKDIRDFFDFIRNQGRFVLTEPEAKKILEIAGIPITKEVLAVNADEAQEIAEKIGYPVVMKIVSPQILHKSESGGIKINLKSKASVKKSYSEIIEKTNKFNPLAEIHGVLIQEMLSGGIETIIGVTTDDQFGPVIMFGVGGIFVEVMGDVTFRIVPIDKRNAFDMLEEIKGKKILEGFRGFPQIDKEKLTDIMVKLSEFSFKFRDDIQEIDINPLYCNTGKIKAMDALIILKAEK